MTLTTTEEQTLFSDSVSRFLADEYSFEKRLEITDAGVGFLNEHWSIFAELGWLGVPFSEKYGGLGCTAAEVAIVMEQIGRGLLVSPYLSTIVLCGQVIVLAGSDAQKEALLPTVVDGSLKLALAFAEPQARFNLADVETTAAKTTNGYFIDGHKSVVLYGEVADKLIVSARTSGEFRDESGISLFLIDRDADGVSATHHRTNDGGRASCFDFNHVFVEADAVLGELDQAFHVLEAAVDCSIVAVCAEAVGAMWAVFEQTLDYLKTREQFGKPLGSFQALQHRMVDVYIKCEFAESIVSQAIAAIDNPNRIVRRKAVSAAKNLVGRYGRDVGQEGVQLHGGIGMTMELPIGHYLKRLTMINASFGNADYHLGLYSELSLTDNSVF